MSPGPCRGCRACGRCYAIVSRLLGWTTRAHTVVRGRVERPRGRPVRALHRRRRERGLLRPLHRVRRRGDRPAAPQTTDFRRIHVVAPPRSRRSQQGPGAVPPADPRRLLRVVPSRRRAIRHRSDDIRRWPAAMPLPGAIASWSSVQLGNCGSPIELDQGWLVLTHGVGAMRTYSIGALLLDLDDPTIVLGQTAHPLIAPHPATGTAMCRTSSTLAARSATATTSSFRSASPIKDQLRHPHRQRGARRSDSATTEMRHPWPTSHHANINRRRPASR